MAVLDIEELAEPRSVHRYFVHPACFAFAFHAGKPVRDLLFDALVFFFALFVTSLFFQFPNRIFRKFDSLRLVPVNGNIDHRVQMFGQHFHLALRANVVHQNHIIAAPRALNHF